jgi:pimeloyl-ACP methyl ester carboxylesterase
VTQTFRALALPAGLALASCVSLPPPDQPIPVRAVPADPARTAHAPGTQDTFAPRLVVVLPGRGDDLDGLEQTGIAAALQRAVPGTDVLLVEATYGYYMEGRLIPRLHEEVIEPARRRGYQEIWLAGASMGGLGVLMYEHQHQGDLDGLLLMAPYMGSASLQREIRAAGGLAAWDPGPRPDELSGDNVTREEWRVVKSWLTDRERARRVWLVCGEDDGLATAARMIAEALPPGHARLVPGGHRWTVWTPAAAQAFAAAVAEDRRAASDGNATAPGQQARE